MNEKNRYKPPIEKFKPGDVVIPQLGSKKNKKGIIYGKSEEAIQRKEIGTWMVRFLDNQYMEYDEFNHELELAYRDKEVL